MTDNTGTIVWRAHYTSFGEADIEVETIENNFRFPGQYYDTETGLHYNYFRYYVPNTGRYITPDPIGLYGGINLYAYAGNNPVNWIDPWGLRGLAKNYIGSNYTAGQNKTWKNITSEERAANPPDGRLDFGAYYHDRCYADCRSKFKCHKNMAMFIRCENKCDKKYRKKIEICPTRLLVSLVVVL